MAEQTETKRPVMQQFSIKLYPDDIERFNAIIDSMDNVNTKGQGFSALLDNWENPPKAVVKDNPELKQHIAELEAENQGLTKQLFDQKAKNEELQRTANENGENGSKLQLRIDELEAENAALRETKNVPENVITTEVHPVAWYFLKQMAESETKRKGGTVTPGYILTDLFIQDLQNPRSDNLPYTVSSSDIRKVMEQYRKDHPETEQSKEEVKDAD